MGFVKRNSSKKGPVIFSTPQETEEQNSLKDAYAAADLDPDRMEIIDKWAALDDENWNE